MYCEGLQKLSGEGFPELRIKYSGKSFPEQDVLLAKGKLSLAPNHVNWVLGYAECFCGTECKTPGQCDKEIADMAVVLEEEFIKSLESN